MPVAVDIIFETHSWTIDNERGQATGWQDGALAPKGRVLAAELGERRRNDGLAAVFASDLGRAAQTVEIAFAGSPLPRFFDRRLRECNYGEWNGMSVKKLESSRAQHVDQPYPGGQSYRDVVRGVAEFLHEVRDAWDGKRILIIGHSATRWALDHLCDGTPLEDLVDAPFNWREGWSYSTPARDHG
jgi:alpha-ribazole phosphatase/probable phosphoglycerate mutase